MGRVAIPNPKPLHPKMLKVQPRNLVPQLFANIARKKGTTKATAGSNFQKNALLEKTRKEGANKGVNKMYL